MKKKDYELVASVIRKCREDMAKTGNTTATATLALLREDMIEAFLADNRQFKMDSFREACTPKRTT